jgi:protein TonB
MLDASREMDYANDSQQQSTDFLTAMNAHFDPALRPDAIPHAAPIERSRYRRSRSGDPVAIIGALLFAVGAVGAFSFMNPHVVRKEKREPIVVAMLELPDEPPPAEAPPPPSTDAPPPQAMISAPVPIVMTPAQPVIQAPAITAPVSPPAPKPAALAAAPARGPENLGELSAKMISATPPKFPLESRRSHEEGIVVLSVLLSIDGRVSDVSITKSSGFARLDRAALDAVRDWRWSPLMRDGNPVMVRGVVTIPFILQRGGRDGPGRHGRGHGGEDRNDRRDGGNRDDRPGPASDNI